MPDTQTDPVAEAATAVADARAELERAEATRADAIRAALEAGRGATELSRITGLSRERIYQIKDRRR